jgi:RNA polymerase sigma factor (sigma-70 family)
VPGRPLSDEELVAACAAGDKEAWDAFVERFARLVHWSVRRTLEATPFAARQDVSDDVFQEVFRGLLEGGALARLRKAESVRKFLTVIAANRTIDRVKSLSRRERSWRPLEGGPETDGEIDAPAPTPGPAAAAERAEAGRIVERALESLPARERFCLEMHYLEGRTHREIAECLGIPQDTVSTVIRRTRERLKERLGDAKDFV